MQILSRGRPSPWDLPPPFWEIWFVKVTLFSFLLHRKIRLKSKTWWFKPWPLKISQLEVTISTFKRVMLHHPKKGHQQNCQVSSFCQELPGISRVRSNPKKSRFRCLRTMDWWVVSICRPLLWTLRLQWIWRPSTRCAPNVGWFWSSRVWWEDVFVGMKFWSRFCSYQL